jgi:membrane-bound lytic murein transglycosylase A
MIHLQGSAILQLSDGKNLAVGFDVGTKHPFRGISGEYLRKHNVAWHRLGEFFNKNPNELDAILSRNNRFIFFKANPTPDAIGSLGVPVLAERSIATDNLMLPPGAVGLISTKIPTKTADGTIELIDSTRFVLNLDTGSAIKGPGRVDVYMGTGEEAKIKASSLFNSGELYYLFKKM